MLLDPGGIDGGAAVHKAEDLIDSAYELHRNCLQRFLDLLLAGRDCRDPGISKKKCLKSTSLRRKKRPEAA